MHQNCSIVNFKLDWDRSVCDFTVPGEKTKNKHLNLNGKPQHKISLFLHLPRGAVRLDVLGTFLPSHTSSLSPLSLSRSLSLSRARSLSLSLSLCCSLFHKYPLTCSLARTRSLLRAFFLMGTVALYRICLTGLR